MQGQLLFALIGLTLLAGAVAAMISFPMPGRTPMPIIDAHMHMY